MSLEDWIHLQHSFIQQLGPLISWGLVILLASTVIIVVRVIALPR